MSEFPSSVGSRLRAVLVMYRRTLRELRALGPQTLVAPLVVPAFILLIYPAIFSGVFARAGVRLDGTPGFTGPAHYVQYLLAGPMVMSALLATASAGIGVAVERQLGFYDRMQLSVLGPTTSQIARRLGDGTRIALFVLILSVVARVAGAEVPNWPLAVVVTVPLASALGMAFGGLAYSFCLRSGSAEAAQAITPLALPVAFMSNAFVPAPLVTSWMAPIVAWNPVSFVCDAIRAAFAGTFDGGAVLRSVIGIGVLAVVAQVLIARAQRHVRVSR